MAALPTRLRAGALAALLLGCIVVLQAQEPSERAPRRIVSLIPATTEMLFAMGAGNRLAAVSSYDRFPPEVNALDRVGGLLDPNVERILALKPDLVIAYATQTDLRRQLERARIPMYVYEHRGLPDITQTIRALGERIGMKEAAERSAAGIERDLRAIGMRVAGLPRPRTLLVFGHDPGALRHIDASAGYGFLHDLLELGGGADVLGDLKKQSIELNSETVLTRAPDVIIDLRYGDPVPAAELTAQRNLWNALGSVPAVRSGRVFVLVGDEFVVPGPRIVVAAERFARTLHPEAFK